MLYITLYTCAPQLSVSIINGLRAVIVAYPYYYVEGEDEDAFLSHSEHGAKRIGTALM
jgi:hypothetical protein